MNKYYFTFGSGQPHENCYHVIKFDSPKSARCLMFERFGRKWAMMYTSAEEAGVEQFGLKEIK